MAASAPNHATIQALRVGTAAAITLVLAESWHLPHTNLAVWSTHMIMSSHPHTTFQKGIERIVGRAAGIVLGILTVEWIGDLKVLALAVEVAVLIGFFYAYFVGRLSYTYMNAGLYYNAILQIGGAGSNVAYYNGGWMILAVVVGVLVAYLVSWFTGAERDLSIVLGDGKLFPLKPEPLGRAVQMMATMLVAQYLFFATDMAPDSNTFSLFLVSVMPDFQKLTGQYRYFLAGILAGIAYGVLTLLIMNRVLHLPMFVALIFFGEFIASYLAQSGGRFKVVGTEMGQIFVLLAVVPVDQIQSPAATFYNIVALFTYLGIAWVVAVASITLGIVPNHPYEPQKPPERPSLDRLNQK